MPVVQSRHSDSPLAWYRMKIPRWCWWWRFLALHRNILQRGGRGHVHCQNNEMETKQLEQGSDGIREAHPTRQLQSTRNMDKINCLWKVVLHHSLSHHHRLRTVRHNTSTWQVTQEMTELQSLIVHIKRKVKNPNSITGTLFSIYSMLLQVHDFELGPPEEPHGISHRHHWHTYGQSGRNRNFWHSSLCTISTVIYGIPFLIPCQLAALILLAFFKAHMDEGLSERKTNLGW